MIPDKNMSFESLLLNNNINSKDKSYTIEYNSFLLYYYILFFPGESIREGVKAMDPIFVYFVGPIVVGCIVQLFKHWLELQRKD